MSSINKLLRKLFISSELEILDIMVIDSDNDDDHIDNVTGDGVVVVVGDDGDDNDDDDDDDDDDIIT